MAWQDTAYRRYRDPTRSAPSPPGIGHRQGTFFDNSTGRRTPCPRAPPSTPPLGVAAELADFYAPGDGRAVFLEVVEKNLSPQRSEPSPASALAAQAPAKTPGRPQT